MSTSTGPLPARWSCTRSFSTSHTRATARSASADKRLFEGPSMPPGYRTEPQPSDRMPPGIPYIVANECAERFSFYGMSAILVVFMTQHLKNAAGQPAVMSPADADIWFHNFTSFVYFTPIVGALIADVFWGKYNTILWV